MSTSDEQGWKGRGRESAQPMGQLIDHIRRLGERLRALESSSALQSAAISRGGLVIQDGGGLTVRDGGAIRAEYPDGSPAIHFGPLHTGAGVPDGVGLHVQAPDDGTGGAGQGDDVFRAKVFPDGTTAVILGQTDNAIGRLWGRLGYVWLQAETDINLEAPAGWGVLRGANAWLEAKAGTATVKGSAGIAVESGGQIQLKSATGLVFVDHTTTSAAANCYIAATGAIMRSTSSRRYKCEVEDAVVDVDAVLALRPRTWRDRAEVDDNPETTTRYVGFIAEELDDLGLRDYVIYDDQGDPEAIAYDRLTAALVPALRQQQNQITDLQAQVDELRKLITPKETL
ncbi:tail fiber domain-containing protein [Oerskovia sp. NPDC060338]|uniref:tail fiber domain-containing protein n=1 Tax=Oerskovia sp. NPDC060338 TaxID=3347100 RepID=UPI0036502401